ncbi:MULTISPECIES: type II secretion system F family protein [Vibrio]|uniref:Type II secretion system F family protein n=1 Tax=Vibrio cortegadensis TaxID=1328770 RepID=A0ABV4M164_9VIBR|nr:type II secretion system F family protein [Vibrio genomosp. F6]TKF20585.1 type II secretion system F family protein [Vibrio genomosp. F6]
MDTILDLIVNFEINEETLFLGMILLSTSLLIVSISFIVMGTRSPIKRKLEIMQQEGGGAKPKRNQTIDNTLESLAPIISSRDVKEKESLRHKLMHAGFHDSNALTIFYAIKVFSMILGLGTAAAFYFFLPDLGSLNLVMIVSVAAGLYLPNVALSHFVKKRQRRVRGGVPDALDLLVVCTESGLGFNAALRRVADELMISHPDFADELDTVCAKIKAGVEMSDAFEDLIERTGLSEITGLVNMLSHASRIGGSLSQTLRDYTEDFRDKRNQEVEEIAAKIPTKMIFPLLIFIWPCFFIVAIGPALISLSDALGS